MTSMRDDLDRKRHHRQPRPEFVASMAALPGRCVHGYDIKTQHPALCECIDTAPVAPTDEWTTFLTVLRDVAVDGVVHQKDVRPKLRGRVPPKRIASMYAQAKHKGILREIGRERSNDVVGRNTNKDEPYYALRGAA